MQEKNPSILIGVTGLGAGALAAYPRSSDRIVFYEIDPQVVTAAYGKNAFFSFVNDCPGGTKVVVGDARQSMKREFEAGYLRGYDVLALDAFSSDAIPTHLLTREAIALCLEHVNPNGGVLAVNISNRFIDIEPVLADSAIQFGLSAVVLDTNGDPPLVTRSIWVLLSRDPSIFRVPLISSVARPITERRIAWTDDFSSPFALLKWWRTTAHRVRILSAESSGSTTPLEPSPPRK
jgi:hypothetical protein